VASNKSTAPGQARPVAKPRAATPPAVKRAAAERSAAGEPVKRPATKRELARLRSRLEAERSELLAQLDGLRESVEVGGSEGIGEVSFDDDFADVGSATAARERDLSLSNNGKDLLDKVQAALQRMDAGAFGRCETCGEPIEPERLEALPYATLCLSDAGRRSRSS
jgi:DnaK suppressor protein